MRENKLFVVRTVIALFLAVLLVVPAITAKADTTTNEDVTKDTSGVVQVKVVYVDDNRKPQPIQTGTGFLINDETVITCDHVVQLDADTMARACEIFGKSEREIMDRLEYQISVLRDMTIRTTIVKESAEMDYAILRMENRLYDRTYLKLRHSNEVEQTESVYALGFPSEVEFFQDVNTYTSEDVTITNGQVNKINKIGTVEYIQHSAKTTPGNSGGPLVDSEGNVIGICKGATASLDGFDIDYYYAIAIDQLITALDALGIEYNTDGSTPSPAPNPEPNPTPEPTPSPEPEPTPEPGPAVTVDKAELTGSINAVKAMSSDGYTTESWSALQTALESAQTVANNPSASQGDVDAAVSALASARTGLVTAKAPGFPVWAIIAIVVALIIVVIIIVLVIVLVAGGKKKKAPQPTPSYTPMGGPATPPPSVGGGFGAAPSAPAMNNNMGVTNFSAATTGAGETSVLNAGAGETTVLNAGAGETTLLSASVNGGTLTRTKNGDKIKINADNFVIGKEKSRVNYCVSDNTSVSRTHARFTVKGGATYITDLKATNGTYVNNVRLQPNQETKLNPGDKIALSDEEFTFSN